MGEIRGLQAQSRRNLKTVFRQNMHFQHDAKTKYGKNNNKNCSKIAAESTNFDVFLYGEIDGLGWWIEIKNHPIFAEKHNFQNAKTMFRGYMFLNMSAVELWLFGEIADYLGVSK